MEDSYAARETARLCLGTRSPQMVLTSAAHEKGVPSSAMLMKWLKKAIQVQDALDQMPYLDPEFRLDPLLEAENFLASLECQQDEWMVLLTGKKSMIPKLMCVLARGPIIQKWVLLCKLKVVPEKLLQPLDKREPPPPPAKPVTPTVSQQQQQSPLQPEPLQRRSPKFTQSKLAVKESKLVPVTRARATTVPNHMPRAYAAVVSVQPAVPLKPAKPAAPAKQVQPANPARPAKPVKPVAPTQPKVQVAPASPALTAAEIPDCIVLHSGSSDNESERIATADKRAHPRGKLTPSARPTGRKRVRKPKSERTPRRPMLQQQKLKVLESSPPKPVRPVQPERMVSRTPPQKAQEGSRANVLLTKDLERRYNEQKARLAQTNRYLEQFKTHDPPAPTTAAHPPVQPGPSPTDARPPNPPSGSVGGSDVSGGSSATTPVSPEHLLKAKQVVSLILDSRKQSADPDTACLDTERPNRRKQSAPQRRSLAAQSPVAVTPDEDDMVGPINQCLDHQQQTFRQEMEQIKRDGGEGRLCRRLFNTSYEETTAESLPEPEVPPDMDWCEDDAEAAKAAADLAMMPVLESIEQDSRSPNKRSKPARRRGKRQRMPSSPSSVEANQNGQRRTRGAAKQNRKKFKGQNRQKE